MQRVGKIAIWLAGGLVLSAGVLADNVASAGNPYEPIVTRNIFGLNPVADETPPGDPPPKITPNGIMSVFGKLQVLFKVAGTGKAGQPPKDQSYILSEGQRQDNIEVTHIDDKTNLVTFNNHGIVQEIPLASTPAVTASGPGPGGQVSRPNFPRPMGGPSGGNNGNVIGNSSGGGGIGRQNRGMGNGGNNLNNGTGGGSTLQSIPTRAGYSNQQQPQNTQNTLTAEEQMILIAAQHAKAQQEGSPMAAIFPPTPIDKQAGVVPPEPSGQILLPGGSN